jgi:hypothetical protein
LAGGRRIRITKKKKRYRIMVILHDNAKSKEKKCALKSENYYG